MPRFEITIAGELNLDLILYGLPEDIPLERELLANGFRMTLGSSSAILAHNLAVLGRKVGFISLIGDDEMGRMALAGLRESGADVSRVVRSSSVGGTGVTLLLNHGRSRRILTYAGAMSEMAIEHLDFDYLADSRHFHLSSLFLHTRLLPSLPKLFRDLKQRGLTLSLDTNDDPADRWDGVLTELLPLIDVLLPNERELLRIAGRTTLDEALDSLSSTVPLIAVKRGPLGCLLQCGAQRIEIPGIAVTPVDTIGAGDSFNAGFLSAWISGSSPAEAARAGNITGAISVQRPGGTEAFRDRVLCGDFLRQHRFPGA